MRILNQDALTTDTDHVFDQLLKDAPKPVVDWFKTTWTNVLVMKTPWFKEAFLHPVVYKDSGGMFEGLGDVGSSLTVKIGREVVTLDATGPYDIKDAKNKILFYYSPTNRSLISFGLDHSTILARDYLTFLVSEDPSTNLKKMSPEAVIKLAAEWHERSAPDKAKQVWRTLREGSDWSVITEFHHQGAKYLMIRLRTKKALVAESEILDHCVYSYDHKLYNTKTVLASLRKAGKASEPIATIELVTDPFWVVQFYGYDNSKIDHNLENAGIAALKAVAGNLPVLTSPNS